MGGATNASGLVLVQMCARTQTLFQVLSKSRPLCLRRGEFDSLVDSNDGASFASVKYHEPAIVNRVWSW